MEPIECQNPCGVCGLDSIVPRLTGSTQVVANSEAMQTLLRQAARFAKSDAPVAVIGETGTGKEIVARILHANSPRSKEPFIAVNVAALPGELLESELFGHSKGAFTGADTAHRGLFEAADKGTLFLDEIGEMPQPLQAKLLRALQDGEVRRIGENKAFGVDVRIICATHRNLARRVAKGLFREDLYYRLKVLTLRIPTLRERKDDILPLACLFLGDENCQARDFTPRAKKRLLSYAWRGNVRELENMVKHGAALATGPKVDEDDLPEELSQLSNLAHKDVPPAPETLKSLAELEREHILRVLDACQGSQAKAALVLGIARNTLWRKLRAIQNSD